VGIGCELPQITETPILQKQHLTTTFTSSKLPVMRCALLFFLAVLFTACKFKNNSDLVSARWVFSETDATPIVKTAEEFESFYGRNGFNQVFAASKFIIRPDNMFDLVFFQNYRHGKWEHRDRFLVLLTEPDEDSLFFGIDTIGYRSMILRIDSFNYKKLGRMVTPFDTTGLFADADEIRFAFKLDKERYKDEDEDPYSKSNNWWRIKPLEPEKPEQVKKRVLALIDFHILMFQDAWDREKDVVLYTWFSSPLIVAGNGMALQRYETIKADWEDCFYNAEQAQQGYRLLQDGFKKKLKANDDYKRRFLRNRDLLQQLRKNIE
jgi:hypothetical protein